MRFANLDGRAVLVIDEKCYDLKTTSGGKFGPDPSAVLEQWEALRNWAADFRAEDACQG